MAQISVLVVDDEPMIRMLIQDMLDDLGHTLAGEAARIDEALKLERAMSQLRTTKRVVVLHYAPIAATIEGEAPEIAPFLGTSRLAEVIDRHGADLVLHGHAHHGQLEGKTIGGSPVYNVAITLLQAQKASAAYRIFDI